MPITLTPAQQIQTPNNQTMTVQPFNPQAAQAVQGGGALQGALGALGANGGADLKPMIQALQKAKLNAMLQGKLPGTTPQSVGQGTGAGDSGAPPLNLGGNPGPMNA